jgi:hypothetical protein
MAAASSSAPSPTRQLSSPIGDKMKAIEAKVVILGAQGGYMRMMIIIIDYN